MTQELLSPFFYIGKVCVYQEGRGAHVLADWPVHLCLCESLNCRDAKQQQLVSVLLPLTRKLAWLVTASSHAPYPSLLPVPSPIYNT